MDGFFPLLFLACAHLFEEELLIGRILQDFWAPHGFSSNPDSLLFFPSFPFFFSLVPSLFRKFQGRIVSLNAHGNIST